MRSRWSYGLRTILFSRRPKWRWIILPICLLMGAKACATVARTFDTSVLICFAAQAATIFA